MRTKQDQGCEGELEQDVAMEGNDDEYGNNADTTTFKDDQSTRQVVQEDKDNVNDRQPLQSTVRTL
jgi:hypothetical protein